MYFLHVCIAARPGAAMNHNGAVAVSFAFPATMWENKKERKNHIGLNRRIYS